MTAFRPWPAPPAQVRHSPSRMTVFLLQTRRQVKDIVPSFPARDATWHCPRRADILSALDAAQPLSGSYEHWTPKADRMSARRGSAQLRPFGDLLELRSCHVPQKE